MLQERTVLLSISSTFELPNEMLVTLELRLRHMEYLIGRASL